MNTPSNDATKENVKEDIIHFTISANSSVISDTKLVRNNNDCETVNNKQSEQTQEINSEEHEIYEKEGLRKRSLWNTQYTILFIGMICILPIFSLIGLFTIRFIFILSSVNNFEFFLKHPKPVCL